MGSCDFYQTANGKTPDEAFQSARDTAGYEHGHGGYSGTIVEKHEGFVMIPLPAGEKAYVYAEQLMEEDDERISDKWGPAGCIDMGARGSAGERKYLFFGYASS